jgi:hypothetical protein
VQVSPAQPVPVEDTGAKVLQDDVAVGDKSERELASAVGGEVEGDGALVAVAGEIERRHRVRGGSGQERRAVLAGVVAVPGLFDLDDVGAEIAQHLAGQGGGQDPTQIEDADPIKCSC